MHSLHVKYLLVGGGLASSAAAQAIRRRDPDGAALLVGQEVNRPYHRPALSREYLRGQRPRAELFTLDDRWFSEHSLELRTGRRASRLDTTRSAVTLDSGEEIAFDKLLIATGGAPRHLTVPGADLPNVLYLRAIEDADRIRNAIEKALREGRSHPHGHGRAAIIGAGLLGIELAATFTQLGLHVDLIFAAPSPWSKFAGESTGRFLARFLENRGVTLHPQAVPLRIEGDGRVQRLILSSEQSLEVDLIVPALGMLPNKDLLRGTAIASEKAILVDDHCRTSHPGIFAAGDCAAILDPLFGKYRLLDHWESALYLGELAGANMAGDDRRFDIVSSFRTEVFDLTLSALGETRLVERCIVRGTPNPDAPDFLEFGIAADGRIAQVLAVNHRGDDDLLSEMVRRRLNIEGREATLRDPAADLRQLLAPAPRPAQSPPPPRADQ